MKCFRGKDRPIFKRIETPMDHERLLWLIGQEGSLEAKKTAYTDDPEISGMIASLHRGDFGSVLGSPFAVLLFGNEQDEHFTSLISRRLDKLLAQAVERHSACAFLVGYAALHAFLQANVTGPPLRFSSEQLLLFHAGQASSSPSAVRQLRADLIRGLVVDGVAASPLTPVVELFCLAKTIFNHPRMQVDGLKRMRFRTNFLHQRLLSEQASTLQSVIYDDLAKLSRSHDRYSREDKIKMLLERALVQMYYGFDSKAREDLSQAADESGFQFALTGRLGKRTKFQEKDLSQLVVLARSAEENTTRGHLELSTDSGSAVRAHTINSVRDHVSKPKNLDLDDDTLLESISFSKLSEGVPEALQKEESIPSLLAALDPSNQPLLSPLDSAILLSFASSITNTSPQDGLTREETLPYATRVLEGGSSNWQIYSQALLVRSRIEGYRSRTVERGVIQLQALVDQVLIETATDQTPAKDHDSMSISTSFLPRLQEGEAASAVERLQYIHQLSSPTRWELEAELAARWVSLGGFATALEIYERLQMWVETALCYAGLSKETQARKTIRKQLFEPSIVAEEDIDDDTETWQGKERHPLPLDAPRLFCILGDLEQDSSWYERAWEVSDERYARAQRSLGKYYFAGRDYPKSADAYAMSLKIDRVNHSSWFALGSARLQLSQWDDAIQCFVRAVQLEEQDAESWSNLAVALLERGSDPNGTAVEIPSHQTDEDEDENDNSFKRPDISANTSRYREDALRALKRAASLKHDDWRIWENLLIVAGSTSPPAYADMVIAMERIIKIRGAGRGEKAVDEDCLDRLVRHIVTSDTETGRSSYDPSKPGLQRMVVELVEAYVIPLITSSRRLWQIVARLFIWRRRPDLALDAYEKAWRTLGSQSGGDVEDETRWEELVGTTLELVDAYESLGGMERTEGPGTTTGDREMVAKDWRFRARNAIRGAMGRGKDRWEGNAGWSRLNARLQDLRQLR